ncbi:competence/damage-inducible protein A [Radiobacillus kanasensis]|nr:competence/damage-inducible protein A [Radiobacillus kanasensis]UFU01370.1 competence/damage-inducible protein A [Radiobacillus kanasensis]
MKAEIIAVGTELLLGQISNTNAQWLSEQLAKRGVYVYHHSVVGDNLDRVKETFEQAGKRADIVIVTGGLGPTDDDLTREAFQALSGYGLIEDKETMKKIESYFEKANRVMTPNNRKQARVFENSTVFQNSAGMAPGIVVEYQDTVWIFMPGVPREMKAISTEQAFPYLEEHFQLRSIIRSKMLRFIGIGESQLEHDLYDLIQNQTNPTIAPLASEGEVGLRLTAQSESEQEAEELIVSTESLIREKVGAYMYGTDDQTLEQSVKELLNQQGKTLAAAESLTGGMFASTLVSVEGASSVFKGGVVSYASSVKSGLLQVSEQTIVEHGTVSDQTAKEMARNVRELTGAEIGISFTGIAGPDAVEGKPVGTVVIGIDQNKEDSVTKTYQFTGDRSSIRRRTVKKGYELLFHLLTN